MTKLVILSDSHNSEPAIRRILKAEADADALIFLGTACGIWNGH